TRPSDAAVQLHGLSQDAVAAILRASIPTIGQSEADRLAELTDFSPRSLALMVELLKSGDFSVPNLLEQPPEAGVDRHVPLLLRRMLDHLSSSAKAVVHVVSLCAPQELPLSVLRRAAEVDRANVGFGAPSLETSLASAESSLVISRGADT